jgi:membrane-bound metal-dependent hydrolase YbcI (DUF457 family)
VIYRAVEPRVGGSNARTGTNWPALAAIIALSIAHDFDFALGILLGDVSRYHNHFMSSAVVGLIVAAVVGGIAALHPRASGWVWFGVALFCYQLHIILDFFTNGRGVMLLWPWSTERLHSPISLFYGVHWSQGWFSSRHLVTLITEALFISVCALAVHLFRKHGRRRNPGEV